MNSLFSLTLEGHLERDLFSSTGICWLSLCYALSLVQVFELVSAELCLETVELLTREQTETLLKEVAGKTGIKWIEASENFIMSGAFKQVEMSRTYLQQAINQCGGISVFTGLKRKALQPEKRDENESHTGYEKNEGDLNQTSRRLNAMQDEEHFHGQEPNETQSSVDCPEVQYFVVEPKFIKVIVQAHKTEINDIEAECHVQIPREAKEGKIGLLPKDTCSTEEYNKACDLFINLYQQMTQIMKMERFSLKSEKNVINARKKIQEMRKNFPVLVEVAKDQKHWELCGKKHDLEAALEFLREEKIEIMRESDKGTGKLHESKDHETLMDVDPPDSSGGARSNDLVETIIGKRYSFNLVNEILTDLFDMFH